MKTEFKNKNAENLTLPELISISRIRKNLKQSELGELIGVTAMQISYYESGQQSPPLKRLILLNKILELNLDLNSIEL